MRRKEAMQRPDAAQAGEAGAGHRSEPRAGDLSRRELLGAAAAGTAMALLPATSAGAATPRRPRTSSDPLFRALDAQITRAMKEHRVPGVAVGVIHQGREYVRGYGITNVDYPVDVDGDTVFRIGSTTKTFTGTTVMRLVDQGKIDLDAPVRRYLPDFAVADRATAAKVTVRQLLNHSPGWLGDDIQGFGDGSQAIERFVASMTELPQLTPVGTTFAYNNAALVVAGRLIEVVAKSTYEEAVRSLVVDQLKLEHTRFFSEEIVGFNVAASHDVIKGKAVVEPSFWPVPRSINSTGGLISSVRDQLAWARFHLGDGRAPDGRRLLKGASLREMQSNPGPGGTLLVELEGMGVAWMLRPSAEGVRIVQHGGNWPGQSSGFMLVPSRGFAITLLTNSIGGEALATALFGDDWALRTFAGISNPPAEPQKLSSSALAPYEGHYAATSIGIDGTHHKNDFELRADGGRLRVDGPITAAAFAFYRDDYVLDLDEKGKPSGARSNFVRGTDGKVAWLRAHGRLYRRRG
jgi:CubicO group peptidase (beta-lactamase class C family)